MGGFGNCPFLISGFDADIRYRGDSPVTRPEQVLEQVLRGRSDSNIRFSELRGLLLRLGFSERVKGSHRILWKDGVQEILNLQPKGSHAKAYQVKQVRHVILKYGLGGRSDV